MPGTISPQLQAIVAARPSWRTPQPIPADRAAGRLQAREKARQLAATIAAQEKRLGVQVQDTTLGGVHCYILQPAPLPEAHRNQ